MRYLIFYGVDNDPAGGFNDEHFFADDLIAAEVTLHAIPFHPAIGVWAHAVDISTWAIVENWTRPQSREWRRHGATP